MSKKEHVCQQELETYGKFHHALNNAAANAHDTQTANYVKTDKFKETFDSLVVNMMKAENGDELEANYKNFKNLLDKEKEAGHINADVHKALLEPVNQLKSQRAPYLSKPLEKQKNWKKNAWVVGGCAVIATALALTVVVTPLIPAAVLGGAALAYGIADQANELSEHIGEASNEKLAGMHHHNFDDFKQKLDNCEIDKDHKLDIKAYIEPSVKADKQPAPKKENVFKRGLKAIGKATGVSTLFSKKSNTSEKLKAAGKILGMAGLALAVAAMVAVFPPVGIPVAAGIGIGIASTAVIAATGVAVVAEQVEAKKNHKALTTEHNKHATTLAQGLDSTFKESAKQTQIALKNEESKPVIHEAMEASLAPTSTPKETVGAVVDVNRNPTPAPRPTSPTSVADLEEVQADIQHFKEVDKHDASKTEALFKEIDSTAAQGDLTKVVRSPEPIKPTATNTGQQPVLDDDEDEGEDEDENEHNDMHT